MKVFNNVVIVVLILLGISSGIMKVMQMPDDMEFFIGVGFSATGVILFGVVHIIGGILLIFQKTRCWGAAIIAVCFAISTVLIFMHGKYAFGLVSVLSVLLAVYIVLDSAKTKPDVSSA